LRYASITLSEAIHGVICFIGMFTLARHKTRHRGHHRPPEAHATTPGSQPDGISQDPPPAAGAAWARGPRESGSDDGRGKGQRGREKAPARTRASQGDSR
jgi:hypothetical protein